MDRVCVAFKAHMGWVNAVATSIDVDTATPLHCQRVDLSSDKDREVTEPYHVAGGWAGLEQVPRPGDPAAIIRRGTRKQVKLAKTRLEAYRQTLTQQKLHWTRAVVLTGRGWLGEDLEHILGAHAHIHVAEGEAIRAAVRAALDAMSTAFVDQDEKSILPRACQLMNCDPQECEEFMKSVRPAGVKSWRKEERTLALGAWLNRK
jgi:hypothetical protein